MDVIADGDVAIRPMRDEDAEYARVVEWRNRAHVREWWDPDDPPMTLEQVVDEYRPGVTGAIADRIGVIEVASAAVGLVQYYPWSAYPDELAAMDLTVPEGAWGLDILLGDAAFVDRGFGSRAVRMLCDHLLTHEGATAVAFGVDVGNARARRAYEKAGLVGTVEFLDTDMRDGARVRSLLMVRRRGDG